MVVVLWGCDEFMKMSQKLKDVCCQVERMHKDSMCNNLVVPGPPWYTLDTENKIGRVLRHKKTSNAK
jgi:hypothetical protein